MNTIIAIGFDWARPIPPLIQYVGAEVSESLLSSKSPLSPLLIDHMLTYASVNHRCTFVSMGTLIIITLTSLLLPFIDLISHSIVAIGTAVTLSSSLAHAIVEALPDRCVIWALPRDQVILLLLHVLMTLRVAKLWFSTAPYVANITTIIILY
jgi:mRNA-degrading endonuclease YafQ of YafQ-DinJ toxin-antitoxin module